MGQAYTTWTFDADAQGMAGLGLAPGAVVFGFAAGDGSPLAGCVQFAASAEGTEKARSPVVATWEDWGVPPGALVQSVRLTGWYVYGAGTLGVEFVVALRILSSGANVCTDGDVYAATDWPWPLSSWHLVGAQPLRSVGASYWASDTPVQFEAQVDAVSFGHPFTATDLRFDSLTLEINYVDGAGGSASGGTHVAAINNPSDLIWGLGYLYGTQTNTDDVPFGTLQEFSFKDSLSLKELMGPESLAALAVGASERKITGQAKYARIRARQWTRTRGGVLTKYTAQTDPAAGPTLTAAAGSTAFTLGYIGVAYSYVNAYGQTKISPVQTVSVTAGQQINVTALSLPGGITAVDWYMTSVSYASAPLASAGALYFIANNNGSAFSLTAYPVTTAKTPPSASTLGSTFTVYTADGLDEPTPFKLHLMNPSDGSQVELFVYGCISPDIGLDIKLRDWSVPDFSVNIYGDTSYTPPRLFEVKLPGDQTLN